MAGRRTPEEYEHKYRSVDELRRTPGGPALRDYRLHVSTPWDCDGRHVSFSASGGRNGVGRHGGARRGLVPRGRGCRPRDASAAHGLVRQAPPRQLRDDSGRRCGDARDDGRSLGSRLASVVELGRARDPMRARGLDVVDGTVFPAADTRVRRRGMQPAPPEGGQGSGDHPRGRGPGETGEPGAHGRQPPEGVRGEPARQDRGTSSTCAAIASGSVRKGAARLHTDAVAAAGTPGVRGSRSQRPRTGHGPLRRREPVTARAERRDRPAGGGCGVAGGGLRAVRRRGHRRAHGRVGERSRAAAGLRSPRIPPAPSMGLSMSPIAGDGFGWRPGDAEEQLEYRPWPLTAIRRLAGRLVRGEAVSGETVADQTGACRLTPFGFFRDRGEVAGDLRGPARRSARASGREGSRRGRVPGSALREQGAWSRGAERRGRPGLGVVRSAPGRCRRADVLSVGCSARSTRWTTCSSSGGGPRSARMTPSFAWATWGRGRASPGSRACPGGRSWSSAITTGRPRASTSCAGRCTRTATRRCC